MVYFLPGEMGHFSHQNDVIGENLWKYFMMDGESDDSSDGESDDSSGVLRILNISRAGERVVLSLTSANLS